MNQEWYKPSVWEEIRKDFDNQLSDLVEEKFKEKGLPYFGLYHESVHMQNIGDGIICVFHDLHGYQRLIFSLKVTNPFENKFSSGDGVVTVESSMEFVIIDNQ